jgi:predicted lipoprotein with Yx(FWY)xxD motif
LNRWNKFCSFGVYVDADALLHSHLKDISMKVLSHALVLVAVSLVAIGGNAYATDAPVKVTDGVLTGTNGMTLYTFDKDMAGSGKSTCNGPCAANWPPLAAAASDTAQGDYSIITRDDGSKQWAIKGKPVYFWVKDSKPGDKTGDGFNKVWQVAKP